jgi:hypothetical protein
MKPILIGITCEVTSRSMLGKPNDRAGRSKNENQYGMDAQGSRMSYAAVVDRASTVAKDTADWLG